jgi:import receptor subunit TOM22
MVQLEEVADEDFFATQPGPKEDEDDWDTDSGTPGSLMSSNHPS